MPFDHHEQDEGQHGQSAEPDRISDAGDVGQPDGLPLLTNPRIL
jgi:hypothetical protein